MSREISYKWYKLSLLVVWLCAALCISATWIAFCLPSNGALIFGIVVDVALTLSLITLITLFYVNGRADYKKRAIIFAALTLIHLIFFILVLAFRAQLLEEENKAILTLPAIHTIILIGISVAGIYFWIRNKFTFKSAAKEDAQAAFGGPIEEPKLPASEFDEDQKPKKARDEKTGIVSL